MQDPQSLHKYLYVHGDPVQGMDPSGLVSFSIGGFSIQFSMRAYLTTTAVSYGIGKGISAVYHLAVDGDLGKFRWFEPWDLFSLVPGGVVAGIWGKVSRYPIAYLTRSSAGAIVGKLFARGIDGPRLAASFSRMFPSGWSRWIPGVGGGVTWRLSPQRFAHIIERHLPQFYNGSQQALAGSPTGLWPFKTSVNQVLKYLDEAMYLARPPRDVSQLVQVIRLSNGIVARLVIRHGEVISFYPLSGPGVSTVQEVITKGLL